MMTDDKLLSISETLERMFNRKLTKQEAIALELAYKMGKKEGKRKAIKDFIED